MGIEIERKFLVTPGSWSPGTMTGTAIRQGYLAITPDRTVRVRVAGDAAFLTIKGRGAGLARPEFEYPIPRGEAEEILTTLCLKPLIEKTRYDIEFSARGWVIDVFHGANDGLVLAEIELAEGEAEVALPPWVGQEVSGDPRYYNASLVSHPYSAWGGGQ